MRSVNNRGRFWMRLLFTIIALGSALDARNQPASGDLSALYTLFNVDLPPADIVLLMDVSGSMLGKYDTARAAAIQFVSALSEREHLHLRLFAGVVSTPLDASGVEARQRIEQFLPPSPLPGQGTDLGMAIQKGIEFLERPGSASVQIFLLITDGIHQPPASSPYSRDFAGDDDWRILRERAQNLCQQHTVLVYGFGIGNQTDIQLLQQLFPVQNVELVVGNVNEMANFLLQIREQIRQVQLAAAIESDLKQGELQVSLQPTRIKGSASNFTIVATVRNTYRLPVIVERIIIHSAQRIPLQWQHRLNAPHELRTGETLRVELHATSQIAVPRFRLGKTRQDYRADYRIVPVARFKHEAAIIQLQRSEVIPRASVVVLPIELSLRSGIAWGTLISILIAGIGALFTWRTRPFKTERLALRLGLSDWPVGAEPHCREWTLPAGSTKVFGTGANDEPLPHLLPGHITVEFRRDGGVEVRDIQTGTVPLEGGSGMFRFQVGDYAFNGQVDRQESWNGKPICFAVIVLIAVVIAIAFQVYT